MFRVAGLQSEVGPKVFFRGTNLLTKNAPKLSPKMLSLCFVGPKKSHKIPAKFPSPKSKINHRQASAGLATLDNVHSLNVQTKTIDHRNLALQRFTLFVCTINTKIFAIQKKILARN